MPLEFDTVNDALGPQVAIDLTGWAPGNCRVIVEAFDATQHLAHEEFILHLEPAPANAPGIPPEVLLAILLAAGAAAGAALWLRSRGRP